MLALRLAVCGRLGCVCITSGERGGLGCWVTRTYKMGAMCVTTSFMMPMSGSTGVGGLCPRGSDVRP